MSPKQDHPRIRELARQFGLDSRGNCAQRLNDHALQRVKEFTTLLAAETTGTLLQLVAGMLSVRVLFIADNNDILRYASEYAGVWPTLGAQLREEFTQSDTMGLLLAHPSPSRGECRNLAFVDARGGRAIRAYFTAWHEIAHLLLQPPQLSFAGFRRVTLDVAASKDPIESLVDQVAGQLAFYEPFVRPELECELARTGRLTLDGISRVKAVVAPEASFSAAANALVRMMKAPCAFLVAEMRLKPREARSLNSDQLSLISPAAPEAKLRLASAFANDAAIAVGFKIFRNMRVPASSIIARVHSAALQESCSRENQDEWESSGRHLPDLPITVETRRFGNVVYALVDCS